MKKNWIAWIVAGACLLFLINVIVIAAIVDSVKTTEVTKQATTEQVEADSDTDATTEAEERDAKEQTAYTFDGSSEETKGVKVSFTNLFVEEDRAVAAVKIKNKTNQMIELYPDQEAKLTINGKQARPNMDDSDVVNEVMKDSEATMYISFFMPEGVDWKDINEVQFGTGAIYDSNDYEYISNIAVKVEDVKTKVDDTVTLEEN
jgi:hypothetical protein